MTISELQKILHALKAMFSEHEAKYLFKKLLHNLKDIIL